MKTQGFSLAEIAISLGIFAFCLFALLGLFMVGLKTERDSQEEEGAASTLAALTLALENSYSGTNGTYTALAPLENWSWNSTNGAVTSGRFGDYAYWLRVRPANTTGDSRLVNVRLAAAWPPDDITWDSEGRASSARGTATASSFFFLK